MFRLRIIFFICIMVLIGSSCFKSQDNPVKPAGEPQFTLGGQVTNKDTEAVIPNAIVSIPAHGLVDTVDAEGHYRFEKLKVGYYSLLFSAPGFAPLNATVEIVDYENRDVVFDCSLIKAAIVQWIKELPINNPSGIWFEDAHYFITTFDSWGGSIIKFDQDLNAVQIAPYIVSQPLRGLVRIRDHFFSLCSYDSFNVMPAPAYYNLLWRIEPNELRALSASQITFFQPIAMGLSDIAFDGTTVWITDHANSYLAKLNGERFYGQALIPSPKTYPRGITHDGQHFWISSIEPIYQSNALYRLNADNTIARRYIVTVNSLNQLAWDGEGILALNQVQHQLVKIIIPADD